MLLKILAHDKSKNAESVLDFCFNNDISQLKHNEVIIFDNNNDSLADFIIGSEGKTRNEWIKTLYEISPFLKNKNFNFKTTLDLMMFRSFCLIYRALGLNYKTNDFGENIHYLNNNFYLDYTGRIGTQPHIYFIDIKYLDEYSENLNELYMHQLLFKLELYFNNDSQINFTNYFVPFNLPITSREEYKNSYKIWSQIQFEHNEVLKNFCDGKVSIK